MPRKLPPPQAVAPVATLLPPPPPSPIIQTLRKDWRWAAISQFMWTFSDAFGLVDWDIEALEADFDGDEKALIPTLIAKLLFALTYHRSINRENAFESLRKTYAKRRPNQRCILGTEDRPIEWETLGLSQKVQILHELCEWQLEDPARFRGLLKSEEEAVTWRVEPVGWDKDGNTFWLFDDNRLWIQRIPPPPPPPPRPLKKSSQKAKKAARKSQPRASTSTSTPVGAAKKSHKKRQITPELSLTPPPPAEEEVLSGSRRRKSVNFYGNPTPTAQALKRGHPTPSAAEGPSSSRSSRNTRNNPLPLPPRMSESPSKAKNTPLPLGTRVSRRLRNVDDEWQAIPDEWLTPSKQSQAAKAKGKGKAKQANGGGDADESDLSDLTDEEEHERILLASSKKPNGNVKSPQRDPETEMPNATEEDEDKMDVDEKLDDIPDEQPNGAENPAKQNDAEVEAVAGGRTGQLAHDDTARSAAGDAVAVAEIAPASAATIEKSNDTSQIEAEPLCTPPIETPTPSNESQESTAAINGAVAVDTSKADDVDDQTMPTPAGESDKAPEMAAVSGEAEIEHSINGNGDIQAVNAAGEVIEESRTDAEIKDELKIEPEIEVQVEKSDLIKQWETERSHIPTDFIEWEAVCVTLYDWRTFPEQYSTSKDPDEKALYNLLTQEVGPTIISVLIAKEQERIKQEAVNNRKRSSRIATRELEREEIVKREAAEREMEERMERIRAEETRKQREEEEAIAVQKAREDRLKEREERALAREEALIKKAEDELRERERRERKREKRKRRREGEEVSDDSDDEQPTPALKRGSSTLDNEASVGTPNSERWELNCEVCKKVGLNIDEDLDLVCCDDCGRWQHTECHDRLDVREGRGKRNWDQVDFKCKECIHRALRKKQRLAQSQSQSQSHLSPPQSNGHHHVQQQQQQQQGVHPLSQSQSYPTSPYPVVPGSSPGPHAVPALDPARPPPPPLGPGEFYLPYPHPPAREDRPAGYAVFYPPDQSPGSAPGQHGHGYSTQQQQQQVYQQQQYQQQRQRYRQSCPTPQSMPQQVQGYQASPPHNVTPQHPHSHMSQTHSQSQPNYQLAQPSQSRISPPQPQSQGRPSPQQQQNMYSQSSNGPQSSPSQISQGRHLASAPSQARSGLNPSVSTSSGQMYPMMQAQTQPNGVHPHPGPNGHGVNPLPTPDPSLASQRPTGYPPQ
ncbi:uncharacterized protein I303_103222 [Kwoniella dejecticola CBS 10117]|uniref:Zinc finger PHD-type domain-containing protein n=1 Tax=Kwoniella dejecticola CBS 10117 TaxID=1296121 RepID=A0AAJ8KMZ6_9TREE